MRRASIFDPGILLVAAIYGFFMEVPFHVGIFGLLALPLLVLLWISLWRYCYTLLGAFALGNARAPLPDAESTNPVGDLAPLLHAALFMLVIFVLPSTPLFGAGAEGSMLRAMIALPFIAAFPASAAVMGVTGNLTAAMNPSSIANVVAVLGRDYLRLIALLAIFGAVPAVAAYALGGGFLASLLVEMIGTWAQLAAYATIGRAINEHGHDFDLPGEFERRVEHDERERDRTWQAPLDRAYASIRSGFVVEGYRAIRQLAEAEGESLDIYQWLFNRMLLWEDRQHAVAVASRFVERLIAAERLHDALDLADQCRRLPNVRFDLAPAPRARLVEYARSVNRHRSADALERLAEAAPDPVVAQRR